MFHLTPFSSSFKQSEANAALICRAVNNHDALIQTLEDDVQTFVAVCDVATKAMTGIIIGISPQDLMAQIQSLKLLAEDQATVARALLQAVRKGR